MTPEQAQESFRKWLRGNSWFRPGDLAAASVADKLKGVYLPFWSFTMLAQSQWQAQIGEYWYRTETYTTRDSQGQSCHPNAASARNGVVAAGRPASSLLQRLSGQRQPGAAAGPVAANSAVQLAGAQAVRAVFSWRAGWPRNIRSAATRRWPFASRNSSGRSTQTSRRFCPATRTAASRSRPNSATSAPTCACCRFTSSAIAISDKVYRFLLNGQTGKLRGDKPVSGQADCASRCCHRWR